MRLVHNERLKLTAAYLNTVAGAIMVTGVVAPIVALSYDLPGPKSAKEVALVSMVWFLASGARHYLARRLLGGLRP
jgi:hypothetical protein